MATRQTGSDPDENARRLRERFARVPIGAPRHRAAPRTRWLHWLGAAGLVAAACAATLSASPWPAMDTLKHIGAFPNCTAARAFGVDRARVGQPGYYARHDADGDGIACEPIPVERPARSRQ